MVPNKDDQFDDGLDQFDDDLPADDFADDAPDSGEDSFSDEEEWDSYDESGEEGEAQPQPKKKASLFNIILIAVAVLGGGAFMMMKMGGGKAPAPAPAVIAQNTGAPSQPSAAAPSMPAPSLPPAEPTAPATGGFLTSPDNMRAMEQDIAKTYNETELVDGNDVPASPSVPQEVDQAAPPMPTAVEQIAAAPEMPSAPPVTENTAPLRMPNAAEAMLKSKMQDKANAGVAEPVGSVPVAPVTPEPVVAPAPVQDAALVAKLDEVLSRLDRLEGDMRNLKAAPAADVSGLAADIKALERKINEQGAKQAAASKAARPVEERHEVTDVPAPKPQVLGSSGGGVSNVPRAPATPAAAPKWVLKGAQPGQAMVSKPGDSEMRSVVVGDSLPGIGTIRSIGYENGRWVVVGTQGRITQ